MAVGDLDDPVGVAVAVADDIADRVVGVDPPQRRRAWKGLHGAEVLGQQDRRAQALDGIVASSTKADAEPERRPHMRRVRQADADAKGAGSRIRPVPVDLGRVRIRQGIVKLEGDARRRVDAHSIRIALGR